MSGVGMQRPWIAAARRVAVVIGAVLVGAFAGLVIGLFTRTHVELAGSEVSLRLVPGQTYDQVDLSGALTGKRAADRSVFGEPIGVRADFDVDASFLVGPDGNFNPDLLPAYLQVFSDPDQVVSDVRAAFVRHLVWFTSVGAGLGFAGALGWHAYRMWRAGYERRLGPDARRAARAYRAPERAVARRIVVVLVTAAVLNAVPGATATTGPAVAITPDPVLAGTPLAGTQLAGLLRPAIAAAESYVRKYFADTDRYYAALRDRLDDYLASEPVTLPSGPGIVQFGFVTDRHCNVGMDRVVVALLRHYKIATLVSAGDDDFSGTFSFESACTSDLAEKTHQAGVTDVFAAGNHDSPQTLADERARGIKVLDGDVVSAGGLHFLGDPDPRTSRYGQGIVPASTADQRRVLDEQAARIAERACAQDESVIVVLHDPRAGRGALDGGCGKAVIALDGHTHEQAGPLDITLPDGTIGSQFVGASSGGAPNEHSTDRAFASALTVGPLNHDATVNLVSVDTTTGRLVGVTVFRFTPAQQISVEQLSR